MSIDIDQKANASNGTLAYVFQESADVGEDVIYLRALID
jgi:hypothetical protein